MKHHIEHLLQTALRSLHKRQELTLIPAHVPVEVVKSKQFGDLSTPIAMMIAHLQNENPLKIAHLIVEALPKSIEVEAVSIASPGFINFSLSKNCLLQTVHDIIERGDSYGHSLIGRGKKVLVEFVSAPVHETLSLSLLRQAQFGHVLSHLWATIGFDTHREYYLFDLDVNLEKLTLAVWLYYLQLNDVKCSSEFMMNNPYVKSAAEALLKNQTKAFCLKINEFLTQIAFLKDINEKNFTQYIALAKQLLGYQFQVIKDHVLNYTLNDVKQSLHHFHIYFDSWFSLRKLAAKEGVSHLLSKLDAAGYTYSENDMLFFKSKSFGDIKDRVLLTAFGEYTFFAYDAAYHLSKFERGFDLAVDIFAGHDVEYVERLRNVMEVCGVNRERLIPVFINDTQSSNELSYKILNTKEISLLQINFLAHKREHILNINWQQSQEALHYMDYAYHRIHGIYEYLRNNNIQYNVQNGLSHLSLLTESLERKLLNTLSRYKDVLVDAALSYEPQILMQYLRGLTEDFHAYYNTIHFVVDDEHLRDARLTLMQAVGQILKSSMNILGISREK